MFGLGGTEVLVIFVLALLLFGPRKLPEIGRTLGKTLAEFRRATLDFRVNLEREVELDKLKADTIGPLRDILSLGETTRSAVMAPVPQGTLPAIPTPAEPVAARPAAAPPAAEPSDVAPSAEARPAEEPSDVAPSADARPAEPTPRDRDDVDRRDEA